MNKTTAIFLNGCCHLLQITDALIDPLEPVLNTVAATQIVFKRLVNDS